MTSPLPTIPYPPALESLPHSQVHGLYVHIPFCRHKCHYCDFYSITHQLPERMARFVDLLLDEADLWNAARGGLSVRPQTVFFGGGTPTLLPQEQMQRLVEGLRDRFDLREVNEWTVEANPATVSIEYCRMLRQNGIDRLSFGAQSFEPRDLATLERHHEAEDVPPSVEIARAAGFERLNVDLIYAIPGQDLCSWQRTLEAAIELGTSHLSCYGLTFEPNTPLGVKRRMGWIRSVEEDLELEMFRFTRRRLTDAGMPAYEISNYARPGEECRHNLMYWTGGNYIGLGPSAATHLDGHRLRNRPHLGEWERAVSAEQLPVIDYEILSPRARAGELAMLMLRLRRPSEFDDFAARSGLDARKLLADPLARFARMGLLDVNSTGFALTDRGVELADAVAAEMLARCR